MRNIEISSDVYDKLGELAKGFDDTPNTVIERLIAYFNNAKNSQLVVKSPKKYNRDSTKYKFNNHPRLAKNRLVLEVIKQYVGNNQNLSFQDLEAKFPKSLQHGHGSYGVFDRYEVAKIREDRFFTKEEELIQLSDTRIAVCTEWGVVNIGKFIKQARKLGFTITEAK